MKVALKTRQKAVLKHPMLCDECGEEIEVGEPYFFWQYRRPPGAPAHAGKQYRYYHCGDPQAD